MCKGSGDIAPHIHNFGCSFTAPNISVRLDHFVPDISNESLINRRIREPYISPPRRLKMANRIRYDADATVWVRPSVTSRVVVISRRKSCCSLWTKRNSFCGQQEFSWSKKPAVKLVPLSFVTAWLRCMGPALHCMYKPNWSTFLWAILRTMISVHSDKY